MNKKKILFGGAFLLMMGSFLDQGQATGTPNTSQMTCMYKQPTCKGGTTATWETQSSTGCPGHWECCLGKDSGCVTVPPPCPAQTSPVWQSKCSSRCPGHWKCQ